MNPKVLEVQPNIFVRNAIDNLTWVNLGDQIVVIDALEEVELADEVLKAIRATSALPITYMINTHRHSDHMALNPFFESLGAEIISFHDLKGKTKTIKGSNNLSLDLIPLPKTHSNKDILVHIPEVNVLCCGDVFGWGLVPWEGRMRQEIYQNICQVYEQMISMQPETVIPGHGPLCTTNELKRWLTYFKDLVEIQQTNPNKLKTTVPPDDMKTWWRFVEWKHQFSLDKIKTFENPTTR